MDSPLLFIRCVHEEEKTHLQVDEKAATILKMISGPISVISIAGLYRTGKSYILNRLAGSNKGFNIGSSIEPCTEGIHMWVVDRTMLQSMNISNANRLGTVILLDTEGIGSYKKSKNYDVQVFSLAVLLSSFFIYNSMGTIDETALDRLALVTELSSFIQTHQGKDKTKSNLHLFVPKFLWLLRDFALKLEKEGKPITPTEYLENALKPLQGDPDKIQSRNAIRQSISDFFQHKSCAVLKRPVSDEKLLQKLEEAKESDLRPEFLEQAAKVVEQIYSQVEIKKLFGESLNGEMFVSITCSYIEMMNNGGVPVIQSAWENVVTHECERAVRAAVDNYQSRWSENSKEVLEDDLIYKLHDQIKTESNEIFSKIAKGTQKVQYQQKMMDSITKIFELTKKNNEERCKEVTLQKLNEISESVQIQIESLPISSIESLENTWKEALKDISLFCKGTSSYKVISDFMTKRLFADFKIIFRNYIKETEVRLKQQMEEQKEDSNQEYSKLKTLYEDVRTSWLKSKEELRNLEAENMSLIGVVANLSNAVMEIDPIKKN